MDVIELLAFKHCDARCLLAMDTPRGWKGCTCTCRGRYHAALVDVVDVPQQLDVRGPNGELLGHRLAEPD